jgi:hypothetical protein
VIAGAAAAFAEDGWQGLRIGGVTLRLVKPCTRCVITTDPETGAADSREPLATLPDGPPVAAPADLWRQRHSRWHGRRGGGDRVELA